MQTTLLDDLLLAIRQLERAQDGAALAVALRGVGDLQSRVEARLATAAAEARA
jgi:hypothetical protein